MTDEEFKAMLQKHGGKCLFSDSIWKRAFAVFGYHILALLALYAVFFIMLLVLAIILN